MYDELCRLQVLWDANVVLAKVTIAIIDTAELRAADHETEVAFIGSREKVQKIHLRVENSIS